MTMRSFDAAKWSVGLTLKWITSSTPCGAANIKLSALFTLTPSAVAVSGNLYMASVEEEYGCVVFAKFIRSIFFNDHLILRMIFAKYAYQSFSIDSLILR